MSCFRHFDINPQGPVEHGECATPAGMRARINRYRHDDYLTCYVLDIADREGLSGEDRMTLLAFEALRRMETLQDRALADAMVTVPRFIVSPDGVATEVTGS